MLKRIYTGIVWGLTTLAVLLLMFPKGAAAEGDLTLSINSVSMLHPGDQATVSVHLANAAAGVNMLQFVVEYDQEELELISTNKGSIFTSVGAPVINDQIPGVIFLNWEGDRTITSDCVLLEMVFSPATSATVDSIVGVSETQELIVSNWETEFDPSLISGTIHIEKEIAAIAVTSMPSKTIYGEGESFDPIGGRVTVTYDDGTMAEIGLTTDMVSSFDSTAIGPQTVTVTYGGVTTTFEVTVVSGASHSVTVPVGVTGGTVEADKTSAYESETVTLTVTPETGYALDTLTATYVDGENATQTLTLTPDANDGTKWTFAMPAFDVTVTAAFVSTVPDLELSPDVVSLYAGQTQQLTLQYADTHAAVTDTGSITWTSSNENIPVDATGCVSLGAGATVGMTATVTANYMGKTATAAVTVVEDPDHYDAFVWKLGAYVGDIQYIRYTILVNKTIADPAFSLRVGGEDRPNVATENDFYTDRLSCLWIQSGPTEVSEYPDYDQYVILVKVFAKQFNTTQTITVKNGSETVRIRSYANTGIEGVVGDCVNHSMVEQMEVYAILNYRNKAAEWRRLKAAMIELAASIAAVNG
ncbi:MAG: bacterial Ig-like domain-containing protein [Verrucomicrobia bacterium]|nr:bacterial Ig-like domain-containing protein [Verrucomicrobiota bacterium]